MKTATKFTNVRHGHSDDQPDESQLPHGSRTGWWWVASNHDPAVRHKVRDAQPVTLTNVHTHSELNPQQHHFQFSRKIALRLKCLQQGFQRTLRIQVQKENQFFSSRNSERTSSTGHRAEEECQGEESCQTGMYILFLIFLKTFFTFRRNS